MFVVVIPTAPEIWGAFTCLMGVSPVQQTFPSNAVKDEPRPAQDFLQPRAAAENAKGTILVVRFKAKEVIRESKENVVDSEPEER